MRLLMTFTIRSYLTVATDMLLPFTLFARIRYDLLLITRDWRAEAQVRCPTQRTQPGQPRYLHYFTYASHDSDTLLPAHYWAPLTILLFIYCSYILPACGLISRATLDSQ
jgi:hypothetical protein